MNRFDIFLFDFVLERSQNLDNLETHSTHRHFDKIIIYFFFTMFTIFCSI